MQIRSTFVDIVSWVFIVLSGFAVFAGVIQLALVFLVFPDDLFSQVGETQEQLPGGWAFAYFRLILVIGVVMMVGFLVTSINLLRRRNWARLAFIGFMVLAIAWNAANLLWQWSIMGEVMMDEPVHQGFTQRFDTAWIVIKWMSVLMTLMFSALFGWIAWMLTRPRIREEFVSN